MNKQECGFTLIELMIVVAIIGVLAAIAIPSYQNYTNRSRITEGLSFADSAKTAITEVYLVTGSFPTDNSQAAMPIADSIHGNNVSSVTVGANGKVDVMMDRPAGTLTLTPSVSEIGVLTWACSSADIPDAYLPSACR